MSETTTTVQGPTCVYVDGTAACARPAEVILRIREGQASGELPLCERHAGQLATALAPLRKRERRRDE